MPLPSMTLAVVGIDFPNRRGPTRRFELAMCTPGEPVDLVPEPTNPADPRAVAVFSARGIQIGYLTAERAPRFSAMLRQGRSVTAIFQGHYQSSAAIRVAFDGQTPNLPVAAPRIEVEAPDFWPDFDPPDD